MDTETLFWLIHLPLMAIFAIGIVRVCLRWLNGAPQSAIQTPGASQTLPGLLDYFQTLLKHLPAAARGFIFDAWFNRRLWHISRWRWLNHTLLLNGFMLLMLLSTLSVLSEKILLPLFPSLSEDTWVTIWVGRDQPLKALMNEIGSLSMTIGLLFYIIRRYLLRPAQLRTGPMDTWLVVGLAAILSTGWLTEALRLNGSQTGAFEVYSFAGAFLARLIAGFNLPWNALFEIQYILHGLLASLLIALVPYSKFMHAPAGGITAVVDKIRDAQEASYQPADQMGYTPRQMVELQACTRCGECVTWCPTFAEKPALDAITPLRKIETLYQAVYHSRSSRLKRAEHAAGVYDCTLCGRCREVCPAHIQTRELWIAMREDLVRQGRCPESLTVLRDTLLVQHNLAGDDNYQRLSWTQNLPTAPRILDDGEQAEILYFTGCVASFYPGSFSIPQAMTRMLEASRADFALLGGEEWCCGFPLYAAGMLEAAGKMMRHNLETVRHSGAKQLLVTCPSCYKMWREQYPKLTGEPLGFKVLHAVDWLDSAVASGMLRLKKLQSKMTYHDPCDLGRGSSIYDAPRRLLHAIPGIEVSEMQHHHEFSLCCGGGGDVEMSDDTLVTAVARRRIFEARETGADLLVTACQQCKRTLTAATRREKTRLPVLDVVELIDRQVDRLSV